MALSKLVGRVEWVAGNTAMISDEHWSTEPRPARAVTEQVAETLHQTAALICDGEGHPVHDPARIEAVQDSTRATRSADDAALEADVLAHRGGGRPSGPRSRSEPSTGEDESIAGSLDPGFHARALGIATEMVADAALEAAGADAVVDRRLGMADESAPHALRAPAPLPSLVPLRLVPQRTARRRRAGPGGRGGRGHQRLRTASGWCSGPCRCCARARSGTGATALRAIGGTAVGFIAGSVIMIGVADHSVLLWVLLPFAVLISGMAPSMISFAAGQAAFTLVVIILFNIIQPIGWKVGLTRIEDVAIGCGVSIVVGFLFWPRGATAALGRALSTAFAPARPTWPTPSNG